MSTAFAPLLLSSAPSASARSSCAGGATRVRVGLHPLLPLFPTSLRFSVLQFFSSSFFSFIIFNEVYFKFS